MSVEGRGRSPAVLGLGPEPALQGPASLRGGERAHESLRGDQYKRSTSDADAGQMGVADTSGIQAEYKRNTS